MGIMAEPWLTSLADRLGVACAYHDWAGNFVTVEPSTVIAVLAALGLRADTETDCAASHSELDRRHWRRALPPTIIARSGTETSFWVHVTHGDPAQLWVRLEDGTVRGGIRQADNFTPPFDLDGTLIGEATFVCQPGNIPRGMLFVPYGPPTCKLMGGDTDGTGMPTSKGWDVDVELV